MTTAYMAVIQIENIGFFSIHCNLSRLLAIEGIEELHFSGPLLLAKL